MAGKRLYSFLIIPIAMACLAMVIGRTELAENAERRLLDLRFRLRGPLPVTDSPLQIVAVDDQSFAALNRKWPFDGELWARVVENLNRAGAKLIVFDIEFTEANDIYPRSDSIFARTIHDAGNVILAGKIAYLSHRQFTDRYAVPIKPLPLHSGDEATWAPVNDQTDPDGFMRRNLLYAPTQEGDLPTLNLVILQEYSGQKARLSSTGQRHTIALGAKRVLLADAQTMMINYYGPAGTFPYISLASVLDDSTFSLASGFDSNYLDYILGDEIAPAGVELPNPFKDKIVLIGATVEELHDTKLTPFYHWQGESRTTPGIEVLAHALQTVLDENYLHLYHGLWTWGMALILALLVFISVSLLRIVWGVIVSIGSVILLLAVSLVLFEQANVWIELMAPGLAVFCSFIAASFYKYSLEQHEKSRIREMFTHYVPDEVISSLIRQPEQLKLGGEKRVLTILFADIEGFTKLSSVLEPEELVDFLNDYMTLMTDIVRAEGGIIDKYEGDLVMAEFGAPVPFSDHAQRACQAALCMKQAAAEYVKRWVARGKPEFNIRIGINTGEVIVGNLGSRDLFDYTVIGVPVNICARLEQANKLFGTRIIISKFTLRALGDTFLYRPLGYLHVEGEEDGVEIYELIAATREEITDQDRDFLEQYNLAYSLMERERLEDAKTVIEQIESAKPEDQPTQILRKKIDTARSNTSLESPPLTTIFHE